MSLPSSTSDAGSNPEINGNQFDDLENHQAEVEQE